MAGVKRCIGLDLGSHSIKLAEMAIDKGGVRIVRMLSVPVPVGPDAVEEERNSAIVATVRGLIKQNKITTKRAVFSMPGQTVFVRRVRVPRAPGARLHQIIQFEARQLIPFPLEKTMVEYQVFDTEEEREVEVLLVAMKKETNLEFMRLVRRIGLRPIGISVAPLALFNGQELYRFNVKAWEEAQAGSKGLLGLSFGKAKKDADKGKKAKKPKKQKKGKKGKEAPDLEEIEDLASRVAPEEEAPGEDQRALSGTGFEEVRAYVNIGARATDLAICKPGGAKAVGFTRSIPLGGNQITAAVMKACKCDTVTQAETIKMGKTAVLSGAFEFEADKAAFNEQACAAATALCDRLIAEIRRSLDFFISQPDGVAVDLVVLSGGAIGMPYLANYIEERLGLPVETSTSLNNDQIKRPSQYGDDFDYSPYKIALGLAVQGLGISPLEIDFLPPEIQSVRDFSSQYLDMAALVGIIALMVFFGSQLGGVTKQATTKEIEDYRKHITMHEPRQKKWNEAKGKRDQVQGKLKLIGDQLARRDYWLNFIVQMDSVKPAGVLVTSMSCAPKHADPNAAYTGDPNAVWTPDPKTGKVTLVVEAEQQSAVTLFARNLQKLSGFVKSVQLNPNPRGVVRSEYFRKDVPQFWVILETKAPDNSDLTHLLAKPIIETPVFLGPDGLPLLAPGMGPQPAAPGAPVRRRYDEERPYGD